MNDSTDDSTDDSDRALSAAVATDPTSIDEVIAQLTAIEAAALRRVPRGEEDGIACFTGLYLGITEEVKKGHEDGRFHCGTFILELDVAFACRYVRALRALLAADESAPDCWNILFERRSRPGSIWRFAAVGVNAHVNFDLAFALLDVWEAHPTPLAATAAQRADYDTINTIFRERMDELCEEYEAPWAEKDGSLPDEAGNVAGTFLVDGTRDLAWVFAEQMWAGPGEKAHRGGPTWLLDLITTSLSRALI